MAFKMRSSKFRHVFGKEYKKDQCYDGIRISKVSADTAFCAVNPKFLAVMCEAGGGGSFLVMPLSKVGRVDRDCPLVSGHSAAVMDIKWDPHDDNVIASASEDCTVRLWNIPDVGLEAPLTDAIVVLHGHQKRVSLIEFHPTAKDVLLSCGLDLVINIWNCEDGTVIASCVTPDLINCVSFNYQGSEFVTSCKNKSLIVYDAYTLGVLNEFKGHEGSKPMMCAYAKDSKIITTGFSRSSERQYSVYDLKKNEKICPETTIDNNNGVLQIQYDYDTGMIFLWAKGDSIIRYYEITEDKPYMHYLSLFQSKESQKGMGWMPKRGLQVNACEIARCYKLWNNGLCEVIPFTVPRKSELFQEDLYPDTASLTPALTVQSFIAGEKKDPILMSLRPGGAPVKKEPVVKKINRPEGPAKMSAASTAEPQSVKPPQAQPVQKAVEKTTSNGASEPNLPPAQSGPALPADFDAEKLLKDMADLKTIIKRQDKTIESLEKRVRELEEKSEEKEGKEETEEKNETEENEVADAQE